MHIADLTIWTINVPYTMPFKSALGRRTGTTRTIIRLTSDTGLEGWGETFRGTATAAILERQRKTIIGWNPYALEKLRATLRMTPFFYGYVGYSALAAIEMACFDLIGKETGKALSELIGGSMRETVAVAGVATPGLLPPGMSVTPEAIAEATREFRDRYGFSAIKLKSSADARRDLAYLKAIRQRLPEIGLRVDPNGAWSVADSILVGHQLLPLDLEDLEDPCTGLEGMARLRQSVAIPLCTNMCVVRLEEFAPAARLGAVDVIHGDVFKWGGIIACKRLAALCDAFGMGMNLHSGGELGLSTACHLHLTAATPEITYAIDTVYDLMADDIIERPFTIENGHMAVPTGPGLGVTVDMDKLDHYAKAHARDGDLLG